MNNIRRIALIAMLLIGVSAGFGYWSIYNFDLAFSNFDRLTESNVASANLAEKIEFSTTTSNLTGGIASTTSNATSSKLVSQNFKFVFPSKQVDVYKGCKYKISWTKLGINSINLSLQDAGTRETMGQIAGGVPKNITGEDLDGFEWKVGNVWPGKYIIRATNINGVEINEKSTTINIVDVPENATESDVIKLCNE